MKKERGFVRALWGIDGLTEKLFNRRTKINNDIKFVMNNSFDRMDMVYVFGEKNYNFLKHLGFECKIISKDPIIWPFETEMYRHKLEVFNQASVDFEEFIFLDWDCVPVTKIPENLWDELYQKEEIQASLSIYHRKKAYWRDNEQRKIPCASFVYCRNKKIPQEIINVWETMEAKWSEEKAIALYIDNMFGKWPGIDVYWNKFEPYCFSSPVGNKSIFKDYPKKNIIFSHFNKTQVAKELRRKHIK